MPQKLGYIRVSTASGEQLSALENQRSRVLAAGVDAVIEDVQSGRESDRQGLLHLLDLINRGQVREVVFTRVDRLGRDAADTDAVIAFAAKRHVRLTALDGGTVESETPQGFVMSRIMTTMAEMESRMLSQRIKAGFAERRKRKEPYNGRAPWGYRCREDGKALEPDPEQWPLAVEFIEILISLDWRMNKALDERDRRHPGQKIPLNSCRAVRSWLMNPVLRGGIGYKQLPNHRHEEVVWGTHEALISHELFERFEVVLAQNRKMWGHNAEIKPRLLTGLCMCKHCGRRMSYAGGRKIPAVVCKTRGCVQQYKSTHEHVISLRINEVLAERAKILSNLRHDEPKEAKDLRKQIAKAEALNEPLLADGIQAMKERLRQILEKKPTPALRLDVLSNPLSYEYLSYESMRELYASLVARVVITNQAVEQVDLHF